MGDPGPGARAGARRAGVLTGGAGEGAGTDGMSGSGDVPEAAGSPQGIVTMRFANGP